MDQQRWGVKEKSGFLENPIWNLAACEAEAAHAGADRALAEAHRLDCEVWTARPFLGGPDKPSPSIADALHGDCELLKV